MSHIYLGGMCIIATKQEEGPDLKFPAAIAL